MTPFFAALEFLTILRLRPRRNAGLREVARSLAWFPAVGLLLGALLLAFDRAASRALPLPSVDVLLVVGLVVLTGALHLDGLADAADGLFGGREPAQRLEIMRDVHAGTYAIVAVAGYPATYLVLAAIAFVAFAVFLVAMPETRDPTAPAERRTLKVRAVAPG